jgi:proline iminopeptidase
MKRNLFLLAIAIMNLFFAGCEKEMEINEPRNLVPKTVDQDPSLPAIRVNGARLHAEAFGPADSALVIVLHGGPGGDYRYLLNCKALANQGYRVVFYDQRGAGLSQRFSTEKYTVQLALDDLSGVINYYRTSPTQKVFLLGQSWGAMVATAYINQYPAAISGAILCEPGGLKWKDVEEYVARLRKVNFLGEELNDAVYMEQFLSGKGDQHAILDYKFGLWAETEKGTVGNEGRLPFWRWGAVTNDAYTKIGNTQKPDWTSNLGQYSTKVLFVYSENNKAYGLAHAQKVSAAYPNVELFKTMGAGHNMLSFSTGWNNTHPVILNYLNALKY